MSVYTNRELLDATLDAVRNAKEVNRVVLRGAENDDFSEDGRNKLRVASRELISRIDDLDKPRRAMRRLIQDHHSDQLRKLEELQTATGEAKGLFRELSIAAAPSETDTDSDSDTSSAEELPAWGPRGHYSRFVPRGATRTSGGKKRTKRKATKRRPQKKRKTKKSNRKKRVTKRR